MAFQTVLNVKLLRFKRLTSGTELIGCAASTTFANSKPYIERSVLNPPLITVGQSFEEFKNARVILRPTIYEGGFIPSKTYSSSRVSIMMDEDNFTELDVFVMMDIMDDYARMVEELFAVSSSHAI